MRQRELVRPAIEARDRAAVELGEQSFTGGRDEIAQPAVERFPLSKRLRLSNGGLGQRHIAAATLGVAPQIGGGIVEDLLLHRLVDADWIATDRQQGRGGTCVGARRHGRDVRSEQDEETGGRGACASRRDVHSHGRARIDDVLDDLAHRRIQAAGCVHRDEDQRRAAVIGLVDAAVDVLGHHRVDLTVDVQLDDARRFGGGVGLPGIAGRRQPNSQENGEHGSRGGEPKRVTHLWRGYTCPDHVPGYPRPLPETAAKPLRRRLERPVAPETKRGRKPVERVLRLADGPALSQHPRVTLHPAVRPPESHHQGRIRPSSGQLAIQHEAALQAVAASALQCVAQADDARNEPLLELSIALA